MRMKKAANKNTRFKQNIFLLFLLCSFTFLLCSCRRKTIVFSMTPSSNAESQIDVLIEGGKYDEVLRRYEARLEEIDEDSLEAANIHVLIGNVYYSYKDDNESAKEYLEKAYELSERNHHTSILPDASYLLAAIYAYEGGNVTAGLQYAEQAEKLYIKSEGENTLPVANTRIRKGILYFEAEQWQEALDSYEAAEETYQSLDVANGSIAIRIGRTLIKMEELDLAEERFKEAHSQAVEKDSGFYAARAVRYLGWLCSEREDYQEAIAYYQEALDFFDSEESSGEYPYETALIYDNLSECYEKADGNLEEAMTTAIKACQTIERLDSATEDAKEQQEKYKQKLKTKFEQWGSDLSEENFESWYQSTVLDEIENESAEESESPQESENPEESESQEESEDREGE